jgi:hypothetical protein
VTTDTWSNRSANCERNTEAGKLVRSRIPGFPGVCFWRELPFVKVSTGGINIEDYCVIRPYAEAWSPPYDAKFHEAGPARLRKVYPQSKRDRRIYMGAVLNPRDKLRPVQELSKLVDRRTVRELKQEAEGALKQLLCRAHCGDAQALGLYVRITRAAVQSLELLAKHHQHGVRAEAEALSDWPLNLNQHETEWAKRELKRLSVGAKLPLFGKRSLRDWHRNVWSSLAWDALVACGENKRVVPFLKQLAAGAKIERKMLRYSRQSKAWATFHYLGTGDVVIIADWQAKCAKLPKTCTKGNVADWWNVVKECVLHYWQNPAGNYLETLTRIPDIGGTQDLSDKPCSAQMSITSRTKSTESGTLRWPV